MKVKKKGRPAEERIKDIPLDSIDEPESAHRVQLAREKMEELKRSILKVGLIHPISVKEKGERFEIVSGFRRYLAHKELGRVSIKARIEYRNEGEYELAKLHENLVREDISPYEEALALKHLMEVYGLTQGTIAQSIGKSEAYVSQRLRILTAPRIMQEALKDGKLSFSVARELMPLENEEEMIRLTMYAIENGVTPAVARNWRLQAEAQGMSALAARDEAAPFDADEYTEQKFEFECAACHAKFPFSRMHSVNVCPDCKRIITTPPTQ